MARFPAIRLSGNKQIASLYIRRGKQELAKTKTVRAEMGNPPVYQREVQVDQYTVIRTLLEKDQEFIFIHSVEPEGVVEGKKEEEKEEEEEENPCLPGFIVYKNRYEDVSQTPQRPVHFGHKLVYQKGKWELEDVHDQLKWCGTAAWWFLEDNLRKYYHADDLKRCDMVTWDGGMQGLNIGFETTCTRTLSTTHWFYFQGRRAHIRNTTNPTIANNDIKHQVIGACLLPAKDLEADCFYVLICNKYDALPHNKLYVKRVRRNTSAIEYYDPMTTGAWETVAQIDLADHVSSLPGAIQALHVVGHAYIDKNGKAYIGLNVQLRADGNVSTPEPQPDRFQFTPPFSLSLGGYSNEASFNPYYFEGIQARLEIDMVTGDAEIVQNWANEIVVAEGQASWFLEGLTAYGREYDGGDASDYETDELSYTYEDGFTYKGMTTRIIRTSNKNEMHATSQWSHKSPSLLAVLGGYDALYELYIKFNFSSVQAKGFFKSTPIQVTNRDYDPGAPYGSPNLLPWVPHWLREASFSLECGEIASADLILKKNGAEIYRLTNVFKLQGGSYASGKYTTQRAGQQQSFIDPWWDAPGGADDGPCTGARCMSDEHLIYGSPSSVSSIKTLTFFHPMLVKEVGVGYLENTIVRATNAPVTLTARYVFNGEQKWSQVLSENGVGAFIGLSQQVTAWNYFPTTIKNSSKCNAGQGYSSENSKSLALSFLLRGQLNSGWIRPRIIWALGLDWAAYRNLLPGIQNYPGNLYCGTEDFQDMEIVANLNGYIRTYRTGDDDWILPNHPNGRDYVGLPYARYIAAIHKESVGPNRDKKPYLVYVQHPHPDEVSNTGIWSTAVGGSYAAPEHIEFFSNVLTIDEIDAITGEDGPDKGFPVDFGII